MIISKPQKGTQLSFTLFLVLSYLIIAMSARQVISNANPPWYNYLVLGVVTPLAIFITFRSFINYRVYEFGSNQVTIRYPVLKKTKVLPLSEIAYWKESIVKTGKYSTFKEIEISFNNQFKINIGLKEYTEYPKILSYLQKKIGKKKLME